MQHNINRNGELELFKLCFVILIAAFLYSMSATAISYAAEMDKEVPFPSKAIKIIVPASAGGSLDKEARVFAPFFEKELKASVHIENVVGAQGIIAYNKFSQEKPDGHTLLYFSPTSAISYELTRETSKYTVKNFTPVAALTTKNFTLINSGKWKTFDEFLKEAKQRNVNLAATGGSANTQGHLLEEAMGIKFNWVTYGSGTEGLTAVAGKHVDCVLTNPVPALPLMKAGKLIALAVFSTTPDPFLPGVPTFKELGYDEVLCLLVRAVFAAPPGTPHERVSILEKAVSKAVVAPEASGIFEKSAITVDFKTSAELAKLMLADYAMLSKYKQFIK